MINIGTQDCSCTINLGTHDCSCMIHIGTQDCSYMINLGTHDCSYMFGLALCIKWMQGLRQFVHWSQTLSKHQTHTVTTYSYIILFFLSMLITFSMNKESTTPFKQTGKQLKLFHLKCVRAHWVDNPALWVMGNQP